MYLKKSKYKKNNRTYLSIVHNFWDSNTKKSKTKTIQKIGYLDELLNKYHDPISHFEAIVAEMNEEYKNNNAAEQIKIDFDEQIDANTTNRKNFGYGAFSKIYHELGIHNFLANRQRSLDISYNLNNVMKLMVFSRLIDPASKKKSYDSKDMFFENSDFSLVDMYRALSRMNKFKEELQQFMYENICKQYGKNTSTVYYDVTNYYFEIDEEDDIRKKGYSKERRKTPIVQMGLLMDSVGIPITYKLFQGNSNDCTTLVPILKEIRRDYNLGRLVIVADKGMNSANNIYYNHKRKNGYVFSQSVRKANKELKKYVLNQTGYEWIGDDFKRKSRLYPREIEVIEEGEKRKVTVHEKQVIFYSRDYDKRAKAERESTIRKAREFIKSPSKYNNAVSYGAAKYIKNLKVDKETGELLNNVDVLEFNEKKLKDEEKFDGYYAIITSEWKESDDKIIEMYRGLWKIEESFKISKSDLETRPVYLSREDRIQSHFLICFIALVLSRLLQHKLDNKYCVTRILESLRKVSCSHIKENIHIFDYRDEVIDAIGDVLEIDFTKKFMRLGEIKKFLGQVKKANLH
jgi:transposase